MTIHDKIKDEKLQHDINREAAKNINITTWKKLVNMNILHVQKYFPLIKDK